MFNQLWEMKDSQVWHCLMHTHHDMAESKREEILLQDNILVGCY